MKRLVIKTLLAIVIISSLALAPSWAQETGTGFQSALRGTWRSVCMDAGDSVYIIVTMTLDGVGTSNDKVVFYSDPACGSPTGLVKVNPSNVYKLGKPKEVGGLTAYPIDITIGSWQLIQNGSVITSGGPVPTQFDIIAIQDNKLYTSGMNRANRSMITNPAQRPNTLDMRNYYTR